MLRPSNQEYISTRLIKLGKVFINSEFLPLIGWFTEKYGVTPINIYVDQLPGGHNRVQVIFETTAETNIFKGKSTFGFLKNAQKAVAKKFKELFANYKNKDLLILFYPFDQVAREDANGKIKLKEIENLKHQYTDRLWEIVRYGEHTIFFFFTRDEVAAAKNSGLDRQLKAAYFELLKKEDKFDYFNLSNFNALFDSKQELDEKYEGNWRWYFD